MLTAEGKKLFATKLKYKIYPDGTISVKAKVMRTGVRKAPMEIPRFGVTLGLDSAFENAEYFGLGEKENLPDMKDHVYMGIHKSKIWSMCEDYIKPQENGVHSNVHYVTFTDAEGKGVKLSAKKKPFFFSARPYSNAALNKIIRENLKINNYKDIISGVHYKGDRKNPVRIIVPLELRNQVFKCANGNFLETRVILMVRQPGEIHNGALVYPAPRYFQAFSQLRLLESAAQASEINAGIVQCVENLFRIEEFRSALEPDNSR